MKQSLSFLSLGFIALAISFFTIYTLTWTKNVCVIDINSGKVRERKYNFFGGYKEDIKISELAKVIEKSGLTLTPAKYKSLWCIKKDIVGCSNSSNTTRQSILIHGKKIDENIDTFTEEEKQELAKRYLKCLQTDDIQFLYKESSSSKAVSKLLGIVTKP